MYTLKYELYNCDYLRKHEQKNFGSLSAMKSWIHENTIEDGYHKWLPRKDAIGAIEFGTKDRKFDMWIHEIDSDEGILFTDGKYTGQQKHMSDRIVEWVSGLRQRNYNFV